MKKLIPIILITAFVLTGCGKQIKSEETVTSTITAITTEVTTTTTAKPTIVGIWQCGNTFYAFREDNTGFFFFFLKQEFKYELFEDGSISFDLGNNKMQAMAYSLDGNNLFFSDSWGNMTRFERITNNEFEKRKDLKPTPTKIPTKVPKKKTTKKK